jgi:hypothetical protein
MCNEIREIGRLISSAALIMSVRREVAKVMKEGFIVTDGKHQPAASEYEVVVRCGNNKCGEIVRRIKANIVNTDVERIADGVLGIRTARRGTSHTEKNFADTITLTENFDG